MQKLLWKRSVAVATLLIAVLIAGIPSTSQAGTTLNEWRIEASDVRSLAENDVPRAYKEAQRLQADLPADATPADKARIYNLLARTEVYMAQTEAATSHAQLALDMARKNEDRVGQAEAYLNIVLNSVNQGRIDTLVDTAPRALEVLQGVDRPDLIGEAMLRLAMMYRRIGQFEESVTLCMQAMDIAKSRNDTLSLIYAYQGLGISYDLSDRHTEALDLYTQMRDLARTAHLKLLEADAIGGMASSIGSLGDITRAESLIHEAISLEREVGAPFNISHALFTLTNNLRLQGHLADTLPLFGEVMAIYERYPNKIGLWWTLKARSENLQSLGRLSAAKIDAERAYALAQEIGLLLYQSESAGRLAAIYAATGNYKRAYQLSAEADDLTAKQTREKSSARMVELAQRYQSESKQRQIDELTRREQKRKLERRWLLSVLGGSVALLIISAFFLLSQRRSQRLLETTNAQLGQSQRKLKATFEAIPDMLFELGLDGRYYDFHSPRADQLAVPAEELLGKTVHEILPRDAAKVCLSALSEANEAGVSVGKQFELTLPHGQFWFELSVARKLTTVAQEPHFIVLSRDITERRRIENLLHVREQEFRAMVENSPDIVARYDTQCRRIYINPAMQRQFGLSIDKILGKTPLESSAMTGAAAYMQRIQNVLKSAQETQMEFSFHDIQGGEHWGHMRLVPEFSSDGKVVSVLAITRDISERKRAEEALEKREREFRTLAESIPDNIIRYDSQAHRTYVNSAMAHTLGIAPADLIGTIPEETTSSERVVAPDEYYKKLNQVLQSGDPGELEMIVWHARDGLQRHNVRFVAEHDAQGKIVGVLVIGRDITAQKAAEEALQEREQRYREIFDNASDGLYLLEVTEDGRFRNLDINPTFELSTGMRRDELIGKYVDETVPPEIAQPVIQKYRRCIEAGTAIEEEIELDLPVGRRYYHSTLVPIQNAGRIYRIVGISRDVTKLKQIEHDLEESRAQLRGLTARREQVREEERKHIAREVHDELGQILTGLKLNISIIEHKYASKSSFLREHLRETMMLTDRSLEVARNVASALRPAALDLGIVSALEWLAGRFELNTGIQCEMIIEETEIQLDEKLEIALFRIVQESLTNVARYAKTHRVFISLDKDEDDYILKVRDNGVGFDVNEKKINSFGLVGIRERALMLGGTAVINSYPGKGTEIVVSIPTQSISEES